MKDTLFAEKYAQLNENQKKAVDTIEGPVMVVAGPGTGKTTLLTLRIANILRLTDVGPESILALTFTNSGVSAMRKKLVELIGDEAYRVNIYTFHSFSEHVMKEFGFYFESFANARVITDIEKIELLEKIISSTKLKELVSLHDQFSSLMSIRGGIDSLKQEGVSPAEFASRIPSWNQELLDDDSVRYKRKTGKYVAGDIKPSELEKIAKKIAKAKELVMLYEKYQLELSEESLYDFSDMILTVLKELETNENLKLDLQEKYQYLLVDEHQDTNDGQNALIEHLTDAEHLNGRPNLFTVGDAKQSIYRFQGASAETFEHFKEIYNDIEIVALTENYRSTEQILDASHSVITHTVFDAIKLNAHKKNDIAVTEKEFSNYKFELLHIADDIKEKINEGIDPNEIAVMYRSNKHADDIKSVFAEHEIPYTMLSKDNIFDDPFIRHVISLLRIIHKINDSHHLGKVLFADFLHFNAQQIVTTLRDFNQQTRAKRISLFEYISEDSEYADFTSAIGDLKTVSENKSFQSFFKEMLEKMGCIQYIIDSKQSREYLLKIDKLFDEIKRQSQTKKGYALKDFITFIDAVEKYNISIETYEPEFIDGVKFLTAHKSKGLEFEYVYIINTLRSNWEKSRGFSPLALPIDTYKGDIDDERRLFYVAMTRAKEGLTITTSKTDWEGREKEKTQFISEIDGSILESEQMNEYEKKNVDRLITFIKSADESKSIWDQEYITQLFYASNLSVTALNNYLACPVMYFLRSLVKLPSDYTPALMFGDLIHQGLETFFEKSKIEKTIQKKEVLISQFTDAIDVSTFYGKEYDTYLEHGIEILSDYYDKYHQEWSVNISNEQSIRRTFTLENGEELMLSGIIDKIEYLDSELSGPIHLIDYKTGKPYSDKKVKTQKEDLRRQIIFYHILMKEYKDGAYAIDKAVLDFIEKNSKDEFEQHSISVSDNDIDEVTNQINQMSQQVTSGEFLKNGCQKKDCEYCAMYQVIKK